MSKCQSAPQEHAPVRLSASSPPSGLGGIARVARWLLRGALGLLGMGALAMLTVRYLRARPLLLDHVRAFNRRYLNPLTLGGAGRPGVYVHLLRHVGRRSGRMYETPLEAFAVPGGYVIPMTYGLRADWARNTLAAGGATLLREERVVAVTRPRVVRLAEAPGALPVVAWLGLRLLGIDELLLLERADTPAVDPTEGAR